MVGRQPLTSIAGGYIDSSPLTGYHKPVISDSENNSIYLRVTTLTVRTSYDRALCPALTNLMRCPTLTTWVELCPKVTLGRGVGMSGFLLDSTLSFTGSLSDTQPYKISGASLHSVTMLNM